MEEKPKTLTDTALLNLALQALSAIQNAQSFKDESGDKMILASWQGFAKTTIRQIKNLRKNN